MTLTTLVGVLLITMSIASYKASASSPAAPGPLLPTTATQSSVTESPSAAADERTRFKLYATENVWNLLLLDTRTGKIWQQQFAINDPSAVVTIPVSLAKKAEGPDDRFELVQTRNMWTFILLDRINGRTWQCQYAIHTQKDKTPALRMCLPLDVDTKTD